MARTLGPHERNVTALKRANETACLLCIRAYGSATVGEAARETGLSRPTVESVLSELEGRGIVTLDEARRSESKGSGRPARRYAFNGALGRYASVELLETSVRVAIADLAGRVLSDDRTPVRVLDRGADLLTILRQALDEGARGIGMNRAELLSVAFGFPAAISQGSRLVRSGTLPDWADVDLIPHLSAMAAGPVVVDGSTHLALLAERHVGAAQLHDDVMMVHGAGDVPFGLLIGGKIHRGRSGRAGEGFAVPPQLVDEVVRGTLLLEAAVADRVAGALQARALAITVAQWIAPVVKVMDPELIVLGGEVGMAGALLCAEVREALGRLLDDRQAPRVLASTLGRDAVLAGGFIAGYGPAIKQILGSTVPAPAPDFSHVLRGKVAIPAPKDGYPVENGGSPSSADLTSLSETGPVAPTTGPVAPTTMMGPATARSLRLGVVGVGARARLATWVELDPLATVVAVADPAAQTGSRARDLFGPGTKVFRSHQDLLELRPPLDAVFVTTPDDTHAAVTIDFLRAGIPVYLEKPVAPTIEQADAILRAGADTGTRLYIGHNMRHMAVVKLMKRLVDDGAIGQVKAIWCRHFVGHGGDFYFQDWHADQRRTTSLLVHKGAHDIDVLHHLAGGRTTDVVGMGGLVLFDQENTQPGSDGLRVRDESLQTWPPHTLRGLNPVVDVEDLSMIAMRLDNGVLCSYQQCHFTPDYWRNYTVIGTHGRLENFGDGDGGLVRVWNKRHTYHPDGDMIFPIEGDAQGHDDADQLIVEEFLRFVRGGGPVSTSPVDAWNAAVTGICATSSLRQNSVPMKVPALDPAVSAYYRPQQIPILKS